MIGNYQLPRLEFLQQADLSAKPTESKEALLANANLMKQTLAQFDIPVELGDITKGPTITRYELHPAPGVKLEKIAALNNNIAAALKAERIHILAPGPGKSSVGVECRTRSRPRSSCATCSRRKNGAAARRRFPLPWARTCMGDSIIADLAEMPHLLIAGSTVREIRLHQFHHRFVALPVHPGPTAVCDD